MLNTFFNVVFELLILYAGVMIAIAVIKALVFAGVVLIYWSRGGFA